MTMTIAAAHAQWKAEAVPALVEMYGRDDSVAFFSEDWNNYTDALCKDGELTNLQYKHCPAWDDVEHDDTTADEAAFILGAMGITLDLTTIIERPDSRHFKYWIRRNGVGVMEGYLEEYYLQGSAHTENPTIDTVIHLILAGTNEFNYGAGAFESWADSVGYDTDSRKAEKLFNACKEEYAQLCKLVSNDEQADLREIFQDY